MRPEATPAYLRALTETHEVAIRGVITNYGLPDPRFGPVPLTSQGSTTMDRSSFQRRKSTVTVADTKWIPRKPSDALAANGLGMDVYYGIRSSSLPWTWVPLISAHMQSGTEEALFDGVPVQLVDQMWRVDVDEFDVPQTLKGSALAAMQGLVTTSVPWMTFGIPDAVLAADVSMPATVFESRADALATLAESLGADVAHTDAAGICRVVPVPDPLADPVWSVTEGEHGVLVSSQRTWSSADAPNAVRATGQASSGQPPISDLIKDSDPYSPMYFDGRSLATGTKYPNQTKRLSVVANTVAGCNIAARAAFRNFVGQSKSISLGTICNPALEDGDVIAVRTEPGAAATNHLVDSWSLAHDGSGMTLSSRSATLADAGAR